MNKLIERIPGDDFHNALILVMNSSTEEQEFQRCIPEQMPATHCQAVEWVKVGNAKAVKFYPMPHPLETVACISNHFEDIDEPRLRWLCERAKIEIPPEADKKAIVALMQEKCPLPKGGKGPAGIATVPKTTTVKEKQYVLDPEVAEMDVKTLEKKAAIFNGINMFKSEQNKGATITQLRALVSRLKDKARADKAKVEGRAGLMQRA